MDYQVSFIVFNVTKSLTKRNIKRYAVFFLVRKHFVYTVLAMVSTGSNL